MIFSLSFFLDLKMCQVFSVQVTPFSYFRIGFTIKKQGRRFRWEVSALLVIKIYFLQKIYLSGMYCTKASMASFIFMVCKFNTFFRGNWELRNKNVICLLIFVDWCINEVHFLLILHFIHLSFFTIHTRWTDLLDNLYLVIIYLLATKYR